MSHSKHNELIHETSPYLQQHAHNPVHWLPWGDKALNKAKEENKPIFLSIGYSACHWCHVMERETFMDPSVAELVNEFFIPIKVDREERPDIDHIYMTALQSMSDHGGWPLNMFLTPNAEPFYGGTYFPKEDSHGLPGFSKVLRTIAKTWEQDETNILVQSRQLTQHLKTELNRSLPVQTVATDFLQTSVEKLQEHSDDENGGFYAAPKFPHAFYLDLYIEALRNGIGSQDSQEHLIFTLRKMAEGGIYDQIGGGFHRYSTDSAWLVPHFEKMLYDNAILARTYFEASKFVDSDFNKNLASEICDYVLREMTHREGAFFSSTDADSEGVEGKFFVWTRTELEKILGSKDGALFAEIYGIHKKEYGSFDQERGTPPHDWFEGHVLHLEDRFEKILAKHQSTEAKIQSLKQKLYTYRKDNRRAPFRDEKILTSWNGLMIQALCKGFEVTGKEVYLQAASKALNFLLKHCVRTDGTLLATWKDQKAQHTGTLEDYANLIAALIAFHRVSGEHTYLQKAKSLCDQALTLFWDESEASFYYTVLESNLIARARNLYDQATPSAHGVMGSNLFYLAKLFSNSSYQDKLDRMLVNLSGFIVKMPHAVSTLIKLASWNTMEGKEYVLVHASEELRLELLKNLRPIDILLTDRDKDLELLEAKWNETEATLFICQNKTCGAPIRGEAEIRSHGKFKNFP